MADAKKEVDARRKIGKPKIDGSLKDIRCTCRRAPGPRDWDDDMGCECDFQGTPKCHLCGKIATWNGKITTRPENINICEACRVKLS
jgi:hypothetical protein